MLSLTELYTDAKSYLNFANSLSSSNNVWHSIINILFPSLSLSVVVDLRSPRSKPSA